MSKKDNYSFITMSCGMRRFYFNDEDMNVNDIYIDDIARSLSKICRFNGHCHRHYSVAEHSVLVSKILPPTLALAGLLHDATEAFMGDVTRPLKHMLPNYQDMEHKLSQMIEARFGVSFDDTLIKTADNIALCLEARLFYRNADLDEWGIETFDRDILSQYEDLLGLDETDHRTAARQFTDRYWELVERSEG